jgi:hypothetical protein
VSNTVINQRIGMLFLGLQNLSGALLAEKRDDDARAVEGMALRLRQMAHDDAPAPKKPQRRVVWMAERTILLNERPTHVWTLPGATDCATPPTPPDVPIHGRNAWYQDVGHDWSWTAGRLRYSPGGGFEPCWLLLEYGQ